MVYRIYVEKKPEFASDGTRLTADVRDFLGITALTGVRTVNRYDVEGTSPENFESAVKFVLSEPQTDTTSAELSADGGTVFAVEYLPGQFDQRADSAAQCIQIMTKGERPTVRWARVYVLYGKLSSDDISRIKRYVINPVDSREASVSLPETLARATGKTGDVAIIDGFTSLDRAGLSRLSESFGLAMDTDDLEFMRRYFAGCGREPTITELRVIDTYWSDHCRHTTFLTEIDRVEFEDELLRRTYEDYLETRRLCGRTSPVCLMDVATAAARYLKKTGKLQGLDESEEINACTVRINVDIDGVREPWLLLFKNETHNHPTEIEPFGGAATCIGGAIRDPLSGRAYVYGAMRVTGAADPRAPLSDTIPGKLPQRKIVTGAADGYSSYGNQIGLATGLVDEIYHPGYAAKRMEIGAVIGAVPERYVRRERPSPGDVVILLGGATGRDGCGGATGSSKAHTSESLETCGAEVQKGNAPEERKLQRFFRNFDVCRMIKRCNDFGAGGVSVAVGELADGLDIDLDAVPKKYDGLDGTELAISESQERMAVVISEADTEAFLRAAEAENLSATPIARVTDRGRLTMSWNGKVIVDLDREFLNSNGAAKHISVRVPSPDEARREGVSSFRDGYLRMAGDINRASKRGLAERFDSTIGSGTVLMPFGGRHQLTPIQCMVQKISTETGHTDDCSFMAYGFDPFESERSPYHGAYLAVADSVAKLIAAGADMNDVYLTFQEYFARPDTDGERWGAPLAALLGAFRAQTEFGIASVGGKDSMSGSFESIDVPPTLVSFAVTTGRASDVISPEFKHAGSRVRLLEPEIGDDGLPKSKSELELFDALSGMIRRGEVISCYVPGADGVAGAVFKMAIGNGYGFNFDGSLSLDGIFAVRHGSFVVELADSCPDCGIPLGCVTDRGVITCGDEKIELRELMSEYEGALEGVFPCNTDGVNVPRDAVTDYRGGMICAAPSVITKVPRVLIPAFPGTNCEYDSARAVRDAGGEAEVLVVENLTSEAIERSVSRFAKSMREAQILFIPGGFSGGDEPDGSGKFITAFMRSADARAAIEDLLDRRGGLICGICNGFQALIKLGLVPYGRITDPDGSCPTLTFNTIGRHQSKIVRTRVVSNLSPWLRETRVGDVYSVPISHGEGRFTADEKLLSEMVRRGQIATQYVDLDGAASGDIQYNPNGSVWAVEGITSPDGRVFGKMGHSERCGEGLYKNVSGCYDIHMFESAVKFFK